MFTYADFLSGRKKASFRRLDLPVQSDYFLDGKTRCTGSSIYISLINYEIRCQGIAHHYRKLDVAGHQKVKILRSLYAVPPFWQWLFLRGK